MIALLDGNNFYANVEKVFRPSLQGVPLVVLSCNDGAAIARSDEARALGIKMGQPWHEIRHFERSDGLIALSANFSLYADMSDRMMSLAAGLGHTHEIYSIDEGFSDLTGIRGDLKARAHAVRERILQWIGIPCCVGIGPTKTIAKFANHVAKNAERKPGSYPSEHARVCDLSTLSRGEVEQLMAITPVSDVWGIGRRIGAQMAQAGIVTALDLARMDTALARSHWSVVLERTVRELQGLSCIALEQAPSPRKQIARTRSFGHVVTALAPLLQAVTEFATVAAQRLRQQSSCAGQVLVFIRTSAFRRGPQYSRSVCIPLPPACADTTRIVAAALAGVRAIYMPGYDYVKAGVMLLDLQAAGAGQFELELQAPQSDRSRERLMQALDAVNGRWGRGTLRVGTAALGAQLQPWMSRQERMSPAYTTDLKALPIART